MTARNDGDALTLEPLPAKQQIVLDHLLLGKSVTDAATAAEIDRTTVHRWLKADFSFQAAYNRGRQELQEAFYARLLQLADQAIETIEAAVQEGDVRTSLEVLKGLGLLNGRPFPLNSGDPKDLERESELENRRKERAYNTERMLDTLF